MQYRQIPFTDPRNLPEYMNILRNLQDIHSALNRFSSSFPILELGNVVPNYENRYNGLITRASLILFKNNINITLNPITIDLSIGGMVAEKLLNRKEKLINVLEDAVDKWQDVCDQIERKKYEEDKKNREEDRNKKDREEDRENNKD